MAKIKNRFVRPLPHRELRKLYVVSVEGAVTEPQYFEHFKKYGINIHIIKKKNKSAPNQVLDELKRYLKANKLEKGDEAWVVVDKDNWPKKQLEIIKNWGDQKDCYGVAISVPNFEYWLLLHYDDGHNIATAADCNTRIKKYLKDYHKNLDMTKIQEHDIRMAVKRAKEKHAGCVDIDHIAYTTVYLLVESLLLELEKFRH
jgi:hypothetical protein